ncbi:MAG: Trx7/PDZ domain-containing (seleno)protein [Verrucomicrobiota bacterium]|nr:Trx7/PDZ domain-containing (seleno)protein [Verrucomicrobiota bacterium]
MTTKPIHSPLPSLIVAVALALSQVGLAQNQLLEVLKDENARGAKFWIYNNLATARAEARRTDKPMFVTFRCVPCAACNGFDAEVAKNNQRIIRLAQEKFVAVRQVEMKGVDLSQFQFDYDLNWAAMFLNADGTVYARYGTQSAEGPDAYNTIESLEKTMRRVLALHDGYPANKAALAGKLGKPKPYKTALEMPGMKHRTKLAGGTARNNCVHCHNIHDAEHEQRRATGHNNHDALWRYPLPDNLGLRIDPGDGRVISAVQAGSPAANADLRPSDVLTHADGQAITSIADLQWVLHNLPNTKSNVTLNVARSDRSIEKKLAMNAGWKKTDISWRGSLWSIKPVLATWCAPMKEKRVKLLRLAKGVKPLEVRWINTSRPEGRNAKRAGLRKGDIIIELEGQPLQMSSQHFNMHLKLNYRVGDKLPLTLLRDGKRIRFDWPLTDRD